MKTLILMALMISGSLAQASFHCQDQEGQIILSAEHESGEIGYKSHPANLTIVISKEAKIQLSAHVKKMITRVGNQFNYQLPIDDVSFFISEFNNLTSDPGCKPGSRMTCDYNWSTVFVGYLKLNGKFHDLSCENL